MPHEMKYVMIDFDRPILFFDIQNHSDFKRMGNITSAGYVKIYEKDGFRSCKVYGKSVSLKLAPAQHDEEILNDLLY